MSRFDLTDLQAIIAERAQSDDGQSWTAKLVAGGMPLAGKKLGEEAAETLIAALVQDDRAVIGESADLLYHLMVVLHLRGISIESVLEELEGRTAQSGIAEKQARKAPDH